MVEEQVVENEQLPGLGEGRAGDSPAATRSRRSRESPCAGRTDRLLLPADLRLDRVTAQRVDARIDIEGLRRGA